MKMAPITIAVGVLLLILGFGGYGYAISTDPNHTSPTPLIPAIFGLVLVILGFLARQEKLRMHVMHAAVIIGLVGLIIPVINVLRKVMDGSFALGLASVANILMAVICGIFVGLCVKSFIDARKQRNQAEASATKP